MIGKLRHSRHFAQALRSAARVYLNDKDIAKVESLIYKLFADMDKCIDRGYVSEEGKLSAFGQVSLVRTLDSLTEQLGFLRYAQECKKPDDITDATYEMLLPPEDEALVRAYQERGADK